MNELPPVGLGAFSVGVGGGGGVGDGAVVVVVVVVVDEGLSFSLFPHAAVSAPVTMIATAPAIPVARRTRRADFMDLVPVCSTGICPALDELESTRNNVAPPRLRAIDLGSFGD